MHAGRRVVFVIDEAQNLDEKVLESIRVLSNFETPWAKLLHIVLAGQTQLAERLALPSMAQLRQRISSIIRLAPLTAEETIAYIYHRLWVAGYEGPPLFSAAARLLIAEQSGGIPRNINNLCFHSMQLAYANGDRQIDGPTVNAAIADLSLEDIFHQPDRQRSWLLAKRALFLKRRLRWVSGNQFRFVSCLGALAACSHWFLQPAPPCVSVSCPAPPGRPRYPTRSMSRLASSQRSSRRRFFLPSSSRA